MPYDLNRDQMKKFCSVYGRVRHIVMKQKTLKEAKKSRPDIKNQKAHSIAFVTFFTHHEAFTAHKLIPTSEKGKKHNLVTNWSFKTYYTPDYFDTHPLPTNVSRRQRRLQAKASPPPMSLSKLTLKPPSSPTDKQWSIYKSGSVYEKHHHHVSYH